MTALRRLAVALATGLAAGSAMAEQRFDCVMDPAATISVGAPTVGLLDEVAVDESEGADAGAGKERSGCGSGGSNAYDGDVSGCEEGLAWSSDTRKENLARVTVLIRKGKIGNLRGG